MPNPTREISAVLAQVAEKLAAAQQVIRDAVDSIDWEAVEARLEALGDEAVRLGENGWPLPMWATPAEIADILEASRNQSIDDVFLDYFEYDGGVFYRQLRRSILNKDSLATKKQLLEQCFWAFERERFLVVVPAMITVVEGVVIDAGGSSAVKEKDPKQTAKRIASNAQRGSLNRAVWASVDAFVSRLFDPASFAGPQPLRLNRAWILHGRGDPDWNKADCLRLFQAADTIAR